MLRSRINQRSTPRQNYQRCQEGGAMIIMAYLLILMFLYFTVLMLDVPYMERIGRNMQRTIDAAALAGAIQLTINDAESGGAPNDAERQRGWRNSKRAAFAFLKLNPIPGAESLSFDFGSADAPVGSGSLESLDTSPYNHETYMLTGGGLSGELKITRGVYHRPTNWTGATSITMFYPVEIGYSNRSGNMCTARPNPDSLPWHDPSHVQEPDPECIPDKSVYSAADTVRIILRIDNIPTLFAKLLPIGVNRFNSLTRTALSVPE